MTDDPVTVEEFRRRMTACATCPCLRRLDGRVHCGDDPKTLHAILWEARAECHDDPPRW